MGRVKAVRAQRERSELDLRDASDGAEVCGTAIVLCQVTSEGLFNVDGAQNEEAASAGAVADDGQGAGEIVCCG